MKIFDTHSHYTDARYDEDREEVLKNIKEQGVTDVVLIGATISESFKSRDLAKQLNSKNIFPKAYFTVGVHPDEVKDEIIENDFWDLVNDEDCVAVGEVGLDYYGDVKDDEHKHLQKEWFKKFIEFANEKNKPLIVHSRDAAQDTLDILKKYRGKNSSTIIHCYSYDKEMAKRFLDLDYTFGIGGVVTFKNAKKLIKALQIIPIDKIITETDCPYLSPEPHRGERNISSYIKYVIEKISQIKNLEIDYIEKVFYDNAKKIYKIV